MCLYTNFARRGLVSSVHNLQIGKVINCCSPVPTISWIGPENALSTGRYSLEGFNTTLVLKEIKEYDEGDYSCTASNTQGDNTHTFQIRVAGLTF